MTVAKVVTAGVLPPISFNGKTMALVRVIIIVVMLVVAATSGRAVAASGNLGVSAFITSWGACSVTNVQNITFADLNPLNPVDVLATGSVRVRCIGFNNNFTVGVTQVTPAPLLLTSGPNSIPYSLNLPTSVTAPLYIVGTRTIPITAHIAGNDYKLAPAGSYTDTVTLEISP